MMNRVRLLAALLCCLPMVRVHGTADPLQAGWEELSLLNPDIALDHFASAQGRMARYGEALALLNTQPRSAQRIARAEQIFTGLQSENSRDNPGIAAAFYLARIRQLHAFMPDEAAAIAAYRTLLAEHPHHPIAEQAAPKLALLLLYADVSDADWESHATEISSLLPALKSPGAQRDTRLVLADALLRLHGDHARALPLLEYCLHRNLIVRPPAIATVLLTAAECARAIGRKADAAAYYRRYVREFPREPSASEADRRAARLAKEDAL